MYMYIIITHKPWHSIWLHQHKLQFEYSPKTTVKDTCIKQLYVQYKTKITYAEHTKNTRGLRGRPESRTACKSIAKSKKGFESQNMECCCIPSER